MANTLFDKIWDAHVVQEVKEGPTQLYIDRLYCHEVTSPQAFAGLRARGLKCFRPERIYCMPDHNTPTHDQDKPIEDPVSKAQVDALAKNAADFGLTHFGMMNKKNGIIHVVGPERGLTLPGMTIVCGDSHTSTHGAMGAIAFGIGTSEVEMVMASQCILQSRPKTMRITIDGTLGKGVTAKDVALYMMSKMTTSGATGYFVEYAGEAIRSLTMEGRLTLCNLSIEMGARGGMIAPDEVTFEYIKGREYAPKGEEWDKALAYWKTLKSDDDAVFDKEVRYDAADIQPMITYGTNPGMGMAVTAHIPTTEGMSDVEKGSFEKSMKYMGFEPGESLLGKKVDYVFLGACTNGRIEDFRAFASIVKGRKKADNIIAWLVPGSWMVDEQIREEGLDKVLEAAGFEIRQPGCSACLAMNDDKIPAGKYAVSTSNRNFEGICHGILPFFHRQPQSFHERHFRYRRHYSPIGVGSRYGYAFRHYYLYFVFIGKLLRQVEFRQDLSPAAPEHRPVIKEKGTVAAQSRSITGHFFRAEPQAEELVQHFQCGRGIGRTSSETCTDRRSLFQEYLYRAERKIPVEQPVCTYSQVVRRIPVHAASPCYRDHDPGVFGHGLYNLSRAGRITFLQGSGSSAVIVGRNNLQRIVDFMNGQKERFDIMEAVRPSAQDVKPEIDFYVRICNHFRTPTLLNFPDMIQALPCHPLQEGYPVPATGTISSAGFWPPVPEFPWISYRTVRFHPVCLWRPRANISRRPHKFRAGAAYLPSQSPTGADYGFPDMLPSSAHPG